MNNKLFWKTIFVGLAILFAFSGAVLADEVKLDMEGTTATVPKGNTIVRKINLVPANFPGTFKLKMKWNAVAIFPTFNQLKIELRHDETTLTTKNCYSIQADKTPKCDFSFVVSETEANKSGDWDLRVTNNSDQEVVGFNIEKDSSELNPLIPSFRSVFTPNCPDTVNLDMEGTTLTLPKGGTAEREIYGIGNLTGTVRLRAKWNAVALIPTFNQLKIELFDPKGNLKTIASGDFYSIHSGKTRMYDISFLASGGIWKLRITDNSDQEVVGFNIEKESGELNPLIPSFRSTYKANCSF